MAREGPGLKIPATAVTANSRRTARRTLGRRAMRDLAASQRAIGIEVRIRLRNIDVEVQPRSFQLVRLCSCRPKTTHMKPLA